MVESSSWKRYTEGRTLTPLSACMEISLKFWSSSMIKRALDLQWENGFLCAVQLFSIIRTRIVKQRIPIGQFLHLTRVYHKREDWFIDKQRNNR